MTRAPRSASCRVANGAAIACSSVTTVMPFSGCMCLSLWMVCGESAQDCGGVHGQPPLVVGGPEADRLAVRLGLPVHVERVQVEGRSHRLEAEARNLRVGHL